MFVALAGFVVVVALLESDSLANWAARLDPGVLRTIAVPATAAIQETLHPLGVTRVRDGVLAETAHLGWTDDAVLLAGTKKPAIEPSPSTPGEHEEGVRAASGAGRAQTTPVPEEAASSTGFLAVGTISQPAADLPKATRLTPLAPMDHTRPRIVALTGDSMMAVGLSATLMRQAADDRNLHIVKAFRSGTGLARPDVFNWMSEYPAMIGPEKPDVVIVAIGANDGQAFVVDGKVQAFGTEDWRRTYQARVMDYLAMVESSGARVVWVGLPPMRSPAFNDKIAAINRIDYTVVAHDPKATWWNPATYVGDEVGRFREFASLDKGKIVRLRAPDGIHFSDDGADLLSSVLMKWLDPPSDTPSPRIGFVTPVFGANPAPVLVPAQLTASNRELLRH